MTMDNNSTPNTFRSNIEEIIANIHPGLSVDCVIICFHDQKLKILLNKLLLNNKWMLPGGLILKDEDVDSAARRVLFERTGLENVYLKQFHLFGKKYRQNIENNIRIISSYGISIDRIPNLMTRFATMGYFAFVRYDKVALEDKEDDICEWFDINSIPLLSYDHNEIIAKAIERIRFVIANFPIGYELLPEKFTIVELRKIYEVIMGKEIDKRNFRKKMLNSRLIISLNEVRETDPYPQTFLYTFNQEKMKEIKDLI
jgi:hypothetical protein